MEFGSIVLIALLVLGPHPCVPEEEEYHRELPCGRSLAIPMAHDRIHRFDNDSLLHDGVLYPPHLYWSDANFTYGCICKLVNCVRKCCQTGQVLSDDASPVCVTALNRTIPDLAPRQHQLAEEIRNLSKLTERFALVKNRICPDVAFKLEPHISSEDNFVLQADGSLKRESGHHHNQSGFCLDLHENLETITVLVCHEPEAEPVTAEDGVYPIGIIISIPFFFATLVVYAIIPELRNLYGMTLMCYVGCLVTAYCFLTGGRLVEHGQPLCAAIDKLLQQWLFMRRDIRVFTSSHHQSKAPSRSI